MEANQIEREPALATARQENLRVKLSHASNPDIPGGYWDATVREGRCTKPVRSLHEAAVEARAYIERNGLGGGNWTGGQVYQGPKQIARVSFNGRIWGMDGKEVR